MTRKLTKAESERRIFEMLLPLTGMSLVPNTLQQRNPPAPDIECEIEGLGAFAVELVALDAEGTRTRLNNMHATEEAWEVVLQQWSTAERSRLVVECDNVFLGLQIENAAGLRARTELMTKVQARLLTRPTGFKGELFGFFDRPTGLIAATVHRGSVRGGPRIIAPSAGSWRTPQVGKIKEKLIDKSYQTAAALEFAYSTHDEVDAHVGSMGRIDACVKAYLSASSVRVFHFGFQQLKYTYPPV